MGEVAPQQIRERVWVEKYDHSGETPVLVETTFVETVAPVVRCWKCMAILTGVAGTHCPFCGRARTS